MQKYENGKKCLAHLLKSDIIIIGGEKMEENETYGFLQPLIEISADVLLYWTMKSVNFESVVTESDVSQYHEAICKAYQKYKSNMIESLAFHYPDENNIQHEVFSLEK